MFVYKLPTGTANCIMIRTEITTVIIIYKAPSTPLDHTNHSKNTGQRENKSIIMICKAHFEMI
jgi:hypothetical protein